MRKFRMNHFTTAAASLVLVIFAFSTGCGKSEEGILIKASPEFIAQEKAERAAIEAARAEEEE